LARVHRGGFILLALLLFVCPAFAITRTIATNDRIAFGNWTYDAMTSLASDGLVPDYAAREFTGDRLFNRMQMAQVVASVVDAAKTGTLRQSQAALIEHLVQDFQPELDKLGTDAVADWSSIAAKYNVGRWITFPAGYVRATGQADSNGTPDRVVLPYRVSVFSNLSKGSFALITGAHFEDGFFHELRGDPTPDKVLLQGYSRNLEWTVGRDYQNWGPAYSGSLILSDDSIGFWQGRLATDVDFGKFFGKFKFTQFASVFEDEKTLYFFGRRFEKRISPRWNWGISETVLMNKAPNPSILVLPFYAYQQIFGGPGSDADKSMNNLYGTDLTYRTAGGTEYYGELLIDDITSPSIFGANQERPQKTGYTLGFFVPKLIGPDPRNNFRAEYTRIERQTYEATRPEFPELAYLHNYAIIGSPVGPNAKAIYLRAEQYLSAKWSLIGEYFNQRQTSAGAPERPATDVISLMAAYDITPNKSVALRVSPFRTTLPGNAPQSGVKYDLRALFAF
jgi:hypothetical protein